jgi:hypothetical protein
LLPMREPEGDNAEGRERLLLLDYCNESGRYKNEWRVKDRLTEIAV